MEPNQDRSLVPRPSHELTAPRIGQNRILGEMVEQTLALGREEAVAQTARFWIGEYAWCEPDYGQILLWAEALKIKPITVIEKLIATGERSSKIADGRMLSLCWDLVELPLSDFRFVGGVAMEALHLWDSMSPGERLLAAIFGPVRHPMLRHYSPIVCLREITLVRPSFRNLDCRGCGIQVLTVSGSRELTKIRCTDNKMKKLTLFDVPSLSSLSCAGNQLAELDLARVPNLTELCCYRNRLKGLDLSHIPSLTKLSCGKNQIPKLDLSYVPNLTKLDCDENPLPELDIRPLLSLETLSYDKHSTRLIQRPDQNF